jgi:hypothetical protein
VVGEGDATFLFVSGWVKHFYSLVVTFHGLTSRVQLTVSKTKKRLSPDDPARHLHIITDVLN